MNRRLLVASTLSTAIGLALAMQAPAVHAQDKGATDMSKAANAALQARRSPTRNVVQPDSFPSEGVGPGSREMGSAIMACSGLAGPQ